MAKNKKRGKNNANNNNSSTANNENGDSINNAAEVVSAAPSETSPPETPQHTEDALAPETPHQSDQNTLEQSEAKSETALVDNAVVSVDQMSMDELKAEVLALRQQLQARDKEITELKAQGSKPLRVAVSTASPVTDMAQLQERLAKLRKEQAEADAARDAAWGQLKNVVSEISKLANPEYVASLVKQQAEAPSDNGTTTA